MSSITDRAEIETLFHTLATAHADHDVEAIVEAYAQDAVIYDLAPPLGRRGINRDSVAAWLDSWDGPIRIEASDVSLTVEGNLAYSSALTRMRGRQGSEEQDMVSHNAVSSENEWPMAHRPRAHIRTVLHGWELSGSG
jgi:ketosteroid isomerase-like protein